MSNFDYDVLVIGAGPGGYVAAIRAAQLGFKTACVEKDATLGGTCLNVGCIPSKALLQVSHEFYHAKHHFAGVGIEVGEVKIDVEKMIKNKNEVIKGLTGGIDMLFKKNKITKIVGAAKFLDKNTVQVGDAKVTAKNFIIATGSSVASLPGIQIDEKVIVSSTGALDLAKVPGKMVVIGGGVIGLELGSVWSRLGAKVEVVEYADRITPTMDKEVSSELTKILKKQGLNFHLSTKVVGVEKSGAGAIVTTETLADGKKEKIEADVVLVSVGRVPNSKGLGLEEIGVKINERGFIINHHLKTSVDNIYVVGDVTTGAMLAHKAEDEGVAAAELIAGQAGHVNYETIPNVIYTNPEVASVGKSEEELKAVGIEYVSGKFRMIANSRARATGSIEGFAKILACKKTDRILGCHIIATDAGSMIHEIVAVMEFGGSAEDVARICHAHPTYNEAVKEAALDVGKRVIHS